MDGLASVGRYIFAIAMGAFGVQYFIYAHSAPDLINIPPYTVARPLSAYLIGAGLVVASLSLASGKKAVLSARLLGAALFLVFLIFYAPRIVCSSPEDLRRWRWPKVSNFSHLRPRAVIQML